MITFRQSMLIFLMGGMSIMCASCGNTRTDNSGSSVDSAGNLNRTKFNDSPSALTTADFLVSLYAKGLYEQQASEAIGKKKTQGPVGKFATAAAKTQSSLNKETVDLAAKKDVSLPASLSAEQTQLLQGMVEAGGTDMQRQYLRQLTNDQKAVLVLLQRGAQSNDTDVIHWSASAATRVQAMLDKAGIVQAYLDSLPLGRTR